MIAGRVNAAPAALRHPRFARCAPARHTTARQRRALVCSGSQQFVLYTKPDCPLCDGLKVRARPHAAAHRCACSARLRMAALDAHGCEWPCMAVNGCAWRIALTRTTARREIRCRACSTAQAEQPQPGAPSTPAARLRHNLSPAARCAGNAPCHRPSAPHPRTSLRPS